MLDTKCHLHSFGRDELVVDYCAGTLDTDTAARFERHIHSCATCFTVVAQQRTVWAALDEWRDMVAYSAGSSS